MSLSKPVLIGIGALLLAGAFLLTLVGGTYNSLVGADEDVNKAWSDVESQYQRRADLVPNLVASVKGAAGSASLPVNVSDSESIFRWAAICRHLC